MLIKSSFSKNLLIKIVENLTANSSQKHPVESAKTSCKLEEVIKQQVPKVLVQANMMICQLTTKLTSSWMKISFQMKAEKKTIMDKLLEHLTILKI